MCVQFWAMRCSASKVIDGRYPDYDAVVPIGADQLVQD